MVGHQNNKRVIVSLVDKSHLEHVKQLISSCYFYGGHRGDFLLLIYGSVKEEDLVWFRKKNIYIKYCNSISLADNDKNSQVLLSKFYLFTDYFKRWDHVLYLDVDISVRANLKRLFKVRGIRAMKFGALDKEFKLGGKFFNENTLFSTGVITFSTGIIYQNTFSKMLYLYRRLYSENFIPQNNVGTEEVVLSYFFYGKIKTLPLAYNVMPNFLYLKYNLRPQNIKGVIIHHMSENYFPKPWEARSPFYSEWKDNFGKADQIYEKFICTKEWNLLQVYTLPLYFRLKGTLNINRLLAHKFPSFFKEVPRK